MSTKGNTPLLFNKNQNNVTGNGQYSNFTTNENHQISLNAFFRSSKNVNSETKKVLDYAPTKLSDFSNNNDSQKALHSWNKSTKDLSLKFAKNGFEKEDGLKKGKALSASTLSLYIAAYENLNGANICNVTKEDLKKNDLIKKGLNAKQMNFNSTAVIQNAFEFPRQQNDNGATNPEIAQYRASQQLHNPNQMHQVDSQQLPTGQTAKMDHETPSLTDTTMRFVDSLAPDETTMVTINHSGTSVTLTQSIWRKKASTSNFKRQSQFIVTMSTAESMTDVFPEWINFALYGPPGNRRFRPYDLNMPLSIPRRPESRYKLDPPLTEHGKVAASMTAMGILRNKLPFKIIYCAPEMAAVQTANTVSLTSKKTEIPIRIEPALANWRGFIKSSNGTQQWESKEFYSKLGYNIDLEYEEFLKDSKISQEESPREFLQRKLDFYSKIVDENAFECVLIIGHAATVIMAADGNWDSKTQLLDIERSGMPCTVHGIHLGPDGEHTHLSRPTLPFTPTLFDAQERAKKSVVSEREKPKKRYVKSFGVSTDSGSSEEDSSDLNST